MANDSHSRVCFCYLLDLDNAQQKALLAEDTSDLDTAASDVEKTVSHNK